MSRAKSVKQCLSRVSTAAPLVEAQLGQFSSESGAQGLLQLFSISKPRMFSSVAPLRQGFAAFNSTSGSNRCPCGRVMCMGNHASSCSCGRVACSGHLCSSLSQQTRAHSSSALQARHKEIQKHFPTALSADDFISRVEIALAGYGFTGDNTIAMSNLCRDESCMVLEDKLEHVFGSCFSTHGLGGVLTCGVIGIKAGLSHSPVQGGKERYVFFSLPHIAIDSEGKIGAVSRPNRPGASAACGALIACLGDLKKDGLDVACKEPGVHDPLEPEYSILKQRLARRAKYEGLDPAKMSLVDITALAERVISSDLEHLISKAVDPTKADYAVFTGVQIHNWAHNLDDESVASLEFVGLGRSYVVVDGKKTYLDLHKVPALAPRQLQIFAKVSLGEEVTPSAAATAGQTGSMLAEIPRSYLMKRLGGASGSMLDTPATGPGWSEYVKTTYSDPHASAPKMDEQYFAATNPPKEDKKADTTFTSWLFGKKS